MKTYAETHLSPARRLLRLALTCCLLLVPLFAQEALAAITVTRTSSPVFYTNYFRPVATTASTTLSPVNYIASGNIKHTKLNSGAYAAAGGLLPILPAQNSVQLVKSARHATLPAQSGVVSYTLSATNSAAYDISLDSFIDVLPSGASYVAGSTTFHYGLHFMRFFKFFKAWALTGPLTRISKQRSSGLHANLQLTAVGVYGAISAEKAI